MRNVYYEIKHNIVYYTVVGWFALWIILLINKRYKLFDYKSFDAAKDQNHNLFTDVNSRFFKEIEKRISNRDDELEIEHKMNFFKYQPKFFHYDLDIIQFFYSLRDFERCSPVLFEKMMRKTDEFLSFTEMDSVLTHQVYDIMKDLKKEILNTLQQFIFSIPSHLENKLFEADRVLTQLLDKYMNKTIKENNEQFDKDKNYHRLNKKIETRLLDAYDWEKSRETNLLMY